MKIAYCTPSLYLPGGIERVLTTKANYLAERLGYELFIILTDGKGKQPYYELSPKIQVIQLDINFEELWQLSFIRKIPTYLRKQQVYKRKLRDTLLRIRPDITVSLLRREINFINSIKDGSKKIGEIHINRYNYRNFEAGSTTIIKELFAKIWMHNLVKHLKQLDKFIVLSQEDKENWHELDNVMVIGNPLAQIPNKKSLVTDKKVIAAGRYCYQKGFDILLKAWKLVSDKHPDWELYIYGTGDKREFQLLADQLNIHKNTHIQEAVTDIIEKYCESSIFVLSSRFEGFGMVLAEAMNCGVPVVSFDCPCGPKDIITLDEDGLLVENGNWEKLADGICYLIEHEEIRKQMGHNAQINIKRYSQEKIMQKWMDLFNELLTKNNVRR